MSKIKYLYTQRDLYSNHLTTDRQRTYFNVSPQEKKQKKNCSKQLYQTNLGFSVKNAYIFVLLHLKKKNNSKNLIGINIPEVCVFHQNQPYDIIYSQGSQIKGIKIKQRPKLRQIYSFFKARTQKRGVYKSQQSYACFQNNDFQLLTDTDLFILCRKFKTDTVFDKLQYIRNKLSLRNAFIQSKYHYEQQNNLYYKKAMQDILGYERQKQQIIKLGRQNYLKYLNTKIVVFLNLQNNIRISSCNFIYGESYDQKFYLLDVKQIIFTNLTDTLQKKQSKLRYLSEVRDKILILSPQKQYVCKKRAKKQHISVIQQTMDNQWHKIIQKNKIKQNQNRIFQQNKNKQAFNKLFSYNKINYQTFFSAKNFQKSKRDLFKNIKRLSQTKSRKYSIRYKTQSFQMQKVSSYDKRQ